MSKHGALPLWRQIGEESVWGQRGLAKAGSIWLPVAVLISFASPDTVREAWLIGVVLFAASACRTLGMVSANDIADRYDDSAAGKARWIRRLPPTVGWVVSALLLCAGLSLLLVCGATWTAVAAYLLAVVLGLLYSLSPARLKCRGLLGLAAYGACCAVAYVVLPWAWIGSPWYLLALLGIAVFLDKWVNLHFHQILDYEADRGGGCFTYAVRRGPQAARRTLRPAAHLAFAAMLFLLIFLASALSLSGLAATSAAAAMALAASVYAARRRRRGEDASALVRELPPHYLGMTYALFLALPPLLLLRLSLRAPSIWILVVMATASTLLSSWQFMRYQYK